MPSSQISEASGLIAGSASKLQRLTMLQWWMPIVASSGLFAAIHIGQGLAPVSLFFFGLSLGFLYRATGSVVPPIMLHFMLNGFSMFWLTAESISTTMQ